MIKILRTSRFIEEYRELTTTDASLLDTVADVIHWFEKNPKDTRIRNHPLHRSMEGKWAFSVTDDIRIVYEWLGTNTVRFLAIGGHPQIYSRKRHRESLAKAVTSN